MPDDLLQPKQFNFKEAMKQANALGVHQELMRSTYSLEHQALEPRTVEQWGHNEGKCLTCRPNIRRTPGRTDVV